MRVAVIGASGGMGSFFVRYFLEKGATVRASDISNTEEKKKGWLSTRVQSNNRLAVSFVTTKNTEAAKECDVTILAVPMESTVKVAEEVVGSLKRGSTLVEISSVKGETLSVLRKVVGERARLLSIHPLFGPALETTKGMKMAVIVERRRKKQKKNNNEGEEEEEKRARELFPEARLVPMTRKEHDRTMAVVLSLTHLVNLVYAGTVLRFVSPEEFMRASTPNSSMQLTLAEAVLAQDRRLSYAIQAENPYSSKVAREAARELRRVLAMLEDSDGKKFEEHLSRLSREYRTQDRAGAVIREIYSAAEKQQELQQKEKEKKKVR